MKYYAIGDLHGRFDLLVKAEAKIQEHAGGNGYTMITLGDYIDRGPESRQVIEYLMERDKYPEVICLQGNHEAMAVESIHRQLDPSWWMGNGGDKTMQSYGQRFMGGSYYYGAGVYYSLVPDEHVKWMNSLPLYYETDKQVFVHAGTPNDAPLYKMWEQKREDGAIKMQWMMYHPANHGGWKGKHVVHGHHHFADGPHVWYDEKKGGRTNLDVQAYKTGRIVIGVFDDSQLHALEYLEVTV